MLLEVQNLMSKKKYALFLGCTVPIRGLNYELSARKVAEKLGIEIVDIPDFSCCGFPVADIHYETALTIAARNLALAESKDCDILCLCSACTGHMTKVQKTLENKENTKELNFVNAKLKDFGYKFEGNVKVKHFVRFLFDDIGPEKLKKVIKQPLSGLNIAPHYGCHCVRPSEIFEGFDDPFRPESLDKLIEATGASSVQYRDKMQCCGGGLLSFTEETPMKMVKQKLDHVKDAKADALTLMCPFCNVMYDEYQPTIEEKFEVEYNLPVLFYPQLLGLAMGLDPKKDLAMKKNRVRVKPLLKKLEEMNNGSE
jgi:heterodisulfide reductase subunit B